MANELFHEPGILPIQMKSLELKKRCEICFTFGMPTNEDYSSKVKISDLVHSSSSGCPTCRLIYNAWLSSRKLASLLGDEKDIHEQEICFFGWGFTAEAKWEGNCTFTRFFITPECRHPALTYLPTSRGYRTIADMSQVQILKGWLNDCLSHPGCAEKWKPTLLPTRVIDVGSENKEPRLYLSRTEETGRYVALSYCWGGKYFIRTTKSTISMRMQNIPLSDFPRTLKEAIIVVRLLGYQYLWIDSLCIIQDDASDWEVESGRMADIYRDAVLTFAASEVVDCDGALLFPDPKGDSKRGGWVIDYQPVTVAALIVDEEGRETKMHTQTEMHGCPPMIRTPPSGFQHRNPCASDQLHWITGTWPLQRRGWTHQEQLLSTRIAHFTKAEIVWECGSAIRCECLRLDDEAGATSDRWDLTKSLQNEILVERFDGWRRMLGSYLLRRLTYPTDRLPALSGLAKRMQSTGGGQYLAGLWRDDIFHELLWHGTPPMAFRTDSKYRGPSWSWASSDEIISHDNLRPYITGSDGVLVTVASEFVDARCEPEGKDLTGRVRSGYIILHGPVFTIQTGQLKQVASTTWEFYLQETASSLGYVSPASSVSLGVALPYEGLPGDTIFHLLLIGETLQHGRGLVLQFKGKDIFERIGTFTTWGLRVLEVIRGAQKRTVKII
ncbi:HET-domain-containing protein [Hyaloscypha bicolor E]|uniref:HET-domain-containing protein n=1 Tax=Hyaloscypha bicolor E TaxID=1095630 RepID=A0A2J6SL25_9HELO|nr:HET-domain-containing protein [Hyaloscypha bicolor E]PMD51473.1 HET-domain-containing protein [Hyaloscypha bicolor E]